MDFIIVDQGIVEVGINDDIIIGAFRANNKNSSFFCKLLRVQALNNLYLNKTGIRQGRAWQH